MNATAAALDAPGVALHAQDLIDLRRTAMNAGQSRILAALPGGFATRRKGRGLEVADVREYAPGDDLRHLDRGTTARTGRLHVRQFQEERDRIVLLIADFRASMFWGITRALWSVAAAEALVLIGWQVVESGGRAGVLVLTDGDPAIVPVRGRARAMLDVIGALVDVHANVLAGLAAGRRQAEADEPPLDRAIARAERLAPAGAELILASGFDRPGAALGDRLGRLARRRVPRLIRIADAQSDRLPTGIYPIRLPDGRRARVHLDGRRVLADPADTIVEGWPMLVLDAGDPVEVTARRLAEAFADVSGR